MSRSLTTQAAAKYLNVGTTSIKRWADEGLLPCEKTAGGHRRFNIAALDRFRTREAGVMQDAVELPHLSREVIDALPYGVIQLDDAGVVLLYSRWESEFTGFAVENVEGKSFFSQVAPCTHNMLVMGAFLRGVREGVLDEEIDYTFTYRMEPRLVRLRLLRHQATQTNWITVKAR